VSAVANPLRRPQPCSVSPNTSISPGWFFFFRISLTHASTAHLQLLIAANPRTTFVLLHANYPCMREGSYLTAVFENVYFDIGELYQVSYSWSHTPYGVETLRAACANTSDGWRRTTWVLYGTPCASSAIIYVQIWLHWNHADRGCPSRCRKTVKAKELNEEEAAKVFEDIFHAANRVWHLELETHCPTRCRYITSSVPGAMIVPVSVG
jgi:hypothetical protein